MQTRFAFLGLVSLALAIGGCGDDDGVPQDAGGGADSAVATDSGIRVDAGGGSDAATGADSGAAADAGAGTDSGAATDAGGGAIDAGPVMCSSGLGASCEGSVACPSGFECNLGRCMPQSRQVCGGFAGAACTDAVYTQCLYFTSADFGTCLTPAERACLCALPDAAAHYVCG